MPKKSAKPDEAVPKTQTGIIRANVNREVNKSGQFMSIYANDVQVQTTPWDMRLTFGEITGNPVGDNPMVSVLQTGELRLSLPLAKRLAIILVKQIEIYEQNLGVIPVPHDD